MSTLMMMIIYINVMSEEDLLSRPTACRLGESGWRFRESGASAGV